MHAHDRHLARARSKAHTQDTRSDEARAYVRASRRAGKVSLRELEDEAAGTDDRKQGGTFEPNTVRLTHPSSSLDLGICYLFATPGVSAISISEDPRLPSQFRGLPYWEPVLTSNAQLCVHLNGAARRAGLDTLQSCACSGRCRAAPRSSASMREEEFGHGILRGGGREHHLLKDLVQIGLKRTVNPRESIDIGACECGD